MADIVLKDRSGNGKLYQGVPAIRTYTESGEAVDFAVGNPVVKNVALNFSNGDMEVLPGENELFSKVIIPQPDNLKPENIKKGEKVAGVEGNLAGGEAKIDDKPIRFYDPYGEVIYGYTLAEIQELSELPPGPALSGVVFDRWTHTLEELKSIMYFADVGPTYKYGSNPATVLILETIMASTSVTLCFTSTSRSHTYTIYWGDGSSDAVTGGSSSTTKSHTYVEAEEHVVAIVCTGYAPSLGVVNNSYNYNVMNNQLYYYTTSASTMDATTNHYLKSILIGTYFHSTSYTCVEIKNCAHNSRLRFISIYRPDGMFSKLVSVGTKMFTHCPALKAIAGKNMFNGLSNYTFYATPSLKRLRVNGLSYEKSLCACDDIEEIEYGSLAIKYPMMNKQWAMLMTSETPPTISATDPVWGTNPIYVPDAAVETYKSADGWSNAADYILPASQYHSK